MIRPASSPPAGPMPTPITGPAAGGERMAHRYRLCLDEAQEAVMREHCAHARFVWNLAVEQHAHWHPGRKGAPGYLEQCRQLTAARAEHDWLAAGSQMVQQQALRDFGQAMAAFFHPVNPAGRPSWRKAGRDEGFRVVAVKPGQ